MARQTNSGASINEHKEPGDASAGDSIGLGQDSHANEEIHKTAKVSRRCKLNGHNHVAHCFVVGFVENVAFVHCLVLKTPRLPSTHACPYTHVKPLYSNYGSMVHASMLLPLGFASLILDHLSFGLLPLPFGAIAIWIFYSFSSPNMHSWVPSSCP